MTVSATGVLATSNNAVIVTQPVGFQQNALTSFSLAGLIATTGTTSNFDATVSTLLTEITGSASNDNFMFATGAFGLTNANGGATVNGDLGIDTVTLTTQADTFRVFSMNAANQQNIAGIENIVLATGNTAVLTLDDLVSIANNGSAVNVRNASTTFGSTVNLGAGAAHTFTSASSGNDTVTLGAAGQQVTVSGGGTDAVNTSVAQSLGSSFTGSALNNLEVLTFVDGGININLGSVANETTMAISNIDRVVLAAGINTLGISPGSNITVDAANAGGNATTINGTGNTVTVIQGMNLLDQIRLAGTSAYSVIGGAGGANVISSGGGALSVTIAATPLMGQQTQFITSDSTTFVNATLLARDLAIDGLGNFTISGFGGVAAARLINLAAHTATTNVTTGAFASSISTRIGSGALTVDAGLLTGTLTILENSTGAIAVNGLSLAGSTVTFANPTNVVNATINGTDANARTITTGAGTDLVTISGVAGGVANQTISTNDGNDVINLGGTVGAHLITGGTGADTMTGGEGIDTFVNALVADFAAGEIVNGGGGVDILSFGAVGAITYVGRTVTSVETLTLTAGGAYAVVVTQGTGLVTVNGLGAVGANFTLNHAGVQFEAGPFVTPAEVIAPGDWSIANNIHNEVLTYWDQVTNRAVTLTLVGVETGFDADVRIINGNLVFTVGPEAV